MRALIQSMPWTDTDPATSQFVQVPNGNLIRVRPRQIVLWGCLTEPALSILPPDSARFPLLFDTGFNDGFMIRADHLWDWAGHRLISQLPPLRPLRVRGRAVR